MDCAHNGFHGIRATYDQRRGLLVYFWVCEQCGTLLKECKRQTYRPRFDPQGHERYLPVSR
jgi:hypothetical protein